MPFALYTLLALAPLCATLRNSEIIPAPSPAPGVLERCDPFEACLPYMDRFQYSLDFLCCETGSGWVAAHSMNPLGVSVFFGSFMTALAVAFWFEAFEVGVLTLFTSFIIFETRELELETWAGSILGDALIQGSIGAFLGYLLRTVFDVPGPLEAWPLMNGWMRFKYVGLWLVYSASFIPLTFVGENGEHWGLFAAVGIHALLLFVVFPLATRSRTDNLVVWQRRSFTYKTLRKNGGVVRTIDRARTRPVPEADRRRMFAAWFAINAALASQTTGLYSWAPSDYYQVWSATLASVLGLLLVRILRGRRK